MSDGIQEIHNVNNCSDPVLLTADLSTGKPLRCNPWSTQPCQSIRPRETLRASDLDAGMLLHGRFDLTWDEADTLGWNVGTYSNTAFVQGVELQGHGKSINFDNQLGFFPPVLVQAGRPVGACSSGQCSFDLDRCPEDAFRSRRTAPSSSADVRRRKSCTAIRQPPRPGCRAARQSRLVRSCARVP